MFLSLFLSDTLRKFRSNEFPHEIYLRKSDQKNWPFSISTNWNRLLFFCLCKFFVLYDLSMNIHNLFRNQVVKALYLASFLYFYLNWMQDIQHPRFANLEIR